MELNKWLATFVTLGYVALGNSTCGMPSSKEIADEFRKTVEEMIAEACSPADGGAPPILCATSDLSSILSDFCGDNPKVLFCQDCEENPETLFCLDSSKLTADYLSLCFEHPELPLCITGPSQSSNEELLFYTNAADPSANNIDVRYGNFNTLQGEHVPYASRTITYDSGRRLTEIVFTNGIKKGMIIEGLNTKVIPGVIPNSVGVEVIAFENLQVYSLVAKQSRVHSVCEGLNLTVTSSSNKEIRLNVEERDQDPFVIFFGEGEYSSLTFSNCSFIFGNIGDSYFLGDNLQNDVSQIFGNISDCLSGSFYYKYNQVADFFFTDPRGLMHNVRVEYPDTKICEEIYNQF